MYCPYCQHTDSKVLDTRIGDGGRILRRRRECPRCKQRFRTVETADILVTKRTGIDEPFSKEKLISGVRKACQGRPVSRADLEKLADNVENALRRKGTAKILTNDIGLAILEPLRSLDVVAYMRFASVYQNFDSLEDFAKEIARLRKVDPGA